MRRSESENSDLHVNGSPEERETHYHELLTLSRVSAALSGLRDLDATLEVALDGVLSIMKGAVGGILLLDEETQTLSYRVHRGLSDRYTAGVCLRLGEGIAGKVAQTGKSMLVEDLSTDPRAANPDLITSEGLKAFVSVPLRAKDRVLGVLNVASHAPRIFTQNNKYLLHSIGDQLGVAIEQARLYDRLRKARERYRQLARQTLMAQEEEQKRIARELHDETTQDLSGLALQLQALVDTAEAAGSQDAEFIAKLKKAQILTIQVHSGISRLITDLRPALLDTLGMVPAIRQYAKANLLPLGINASVETRGTVERLPSQVEAGLFRIAQCAIANIAKHSKAKNAAIVVEAIDGEVLLTISDDGVGFDVSKVTDIDERGRGRGLFGMKERGALLGGTGSVRSAPGQGTSVMVRVPMKWSAEDAEDKSPGGR